MAGEGYHTNLSFRKEKYGIRKSRFHSLVCRSRHQAGSLEQLLSSPVGDATGCRKTEASQLLLHIDENDGIFPGT